jgi:hypothetical protein
MQLIERLGWALSDADELERVRPDTAARRPGAPGAHAS